METVCFLTSNNFSNSRNKYFGNLFFRHCWICSAASFWSKPTPRGNIVRRFWFHQGEHKILHRTSTQRIRMRAAAHAQKSSPSSPPHAPPAQRSGVATAKANLPKHSSHIPRDQIPKVSLPQKPKASIFLSSSKIGSLILAEALAPTPRGRSDHRRGGEGGARDRNRRPAGERLAEGSRKVT